MSKASRNRLNRQKFFVVFEREPEVFEYYKENFGKHCAWFNNARLQALYDDGEHFFFIFKSTYNRMRKVMKDIGRFAMVRHMPDWRFSRKKLPL